MTVSIWTVSDTDFMKLPSRDHLPLLSSLPLSLSLFNRKCTYLIIQSMRTKLIYYIGFGKIGNAILRQSMQGLCYCDLSKVQRFVFACEVVNFAIFLLVYCTDSASGRIWIFFRSRNAFCKAQAGLYIRCELLLSCYFFLNSDNS